jgi:hypothetical protein
LQSDVSHSRWLTCQKRNPVAPRGLHVDRIAVANIVEVPMVLTHFGHLFVVQVQLQVIFTRAGQQNAALVNSYWLQNSKGAWVLVWPPAVYSSYHAGACDPAGPSRALY